MTNLEFYNRVIEAYPWIVPPPLKPGESFWPVEPVTGDEWDNRAMELAEPNKELEP